MGLPVFPSDDKKVPIHAIAEVMSAGLEREILRVDSKSDRSEFVSQTLRDHNIRVVKNLSKHLASSAR